MFWNFILGIALYFLQLVLAPKPQNAKPASLQDFNVPVAEEGKEIPVVFGTVNIKSPNVVWYGDLRLLPIKGPRRYGFWLKLTLTIYTSTSSPKNAPAIASDEPHWPAPVSVISRLTPSCLL